MPHSKARKDFLVLLAISMLTLATMYAPQPLLPFIQYTFPQYTNASIALIMTAVFVPLAIAPLIYGTFLSSLETKKVLQWCVLLMGMASLGCALAPTFPLFFVFRLLHGLVAPAILTCIMAHISVKFRGSLLQHALATYVAVTILGGLMGRLVSGGIASVFYNLESAFLFFGICTLMLLWPLHFFKKRAGTKFIRIRFAEFTNILHIKGMKNLLFIEAGGLFVFTDLATYLPFFFLSIGEEVSEWRVSVLYLGYGLGILVAIYSRKITLFVGSKIRTIRLGGLIFLCSLGLFCVPSSTVIFTAMCFVCLGQFLEHSISPGLINRISIHNKGAVNGLYLSAYYTGGALGSYLPGHIYALWGWNVLILFLAFMLALVLLATVGLDKYMPQQ